MREYLFKILVASTAVLALSACEDPSDRAQVSSQALRCTTDVEKCIGAYAVDKRGTVYLISRDETAGKIILPDKISNVAPYLRELVFPGESDWSFRNEQHKRQGK